MEHPSQKLTFAGLWFGFPMWIEGNDELSVRKALKFLEKKLVPKIEETYAGQNDSNSTRRDRDSLVLSSKGDGKSASTPK